MTVAETSEDISTNSSSLIGRAVAAIPWMRIVIVALILAITGGALYGGLELRRAVWFWTDGGHFVGDIANGWRWGAAADDNGLFSYYERLDSGELPGTTWNRKTDYTPLRLTVMTVWVHWAKAHFPGADAWRDEYDITAPLLHFNTACEIVSSILVFLIIRLWTIRMDNADRPLLVKPRNFRGVLAGLFGALIFWFNPAIVWIGHCWPQWDVWLVPFFLAAVFLASADWWFCAGACVVIGAFLKGQMLLGAPILIIWPVFQGRFGAVFRLLSGLACATAAIAMPWMQLGTAASTWCALVALSILLLMPLVYRTRLNWIWALAMALAAVLLSYPWSLSKPEGFVLRIAFAPLVGSLLIPLLPRGLRKHGYALAVAIAVFLTIPLFDAGTAWYTMGFEYGTEKFETMVTGRGSWNIPAMLVKYFGWSRNQPEEPLQIPFTETIVPLKLFLRCIYAICLVLCGIGAAMQSARRDTRFLAAMVAPWLLFFLLLTQMHGRYSIWAAAMSALLAGISPGMALLGIVVSVVSFLGIMENQYLSAPDYDPWMLSLLRSSDPGIGWIYILAAAIFLLIALSPRMRRAY